MFCIDLVLRTKVEIFFLFFSPPVELYVLSAHVCVAMEFTSSGTRIWMTTETDSEHFQCVIANIKWCHFEYVQQKQIKNGQTHHTQ